MRLNPNTLLIKFLFTTLLAFLISDVVAQEQNARSMYDLINNDSLPYPQQINSYRKIIPFAKEEKDKDTECLILMNMGHLYCMMGAFKTSQKYIQEAYNLIEKSNSDKHSPKIALGRFN